MKKIVGVLVLCLAGLSFGKAIPLNVYDWTTVSNNKYSMVNVYDSTLESFDCSIKSVFVDEDAGIQSTGDKIKSIELFCGTESMLTNSSVNTISTSTYGYNYIEIYGGKYGSISLNGEEDSVGFRDGKLKTLYNLHGYAEIFSGTINKIINGPDEYAYINIVGGIVKSIIADKGEMYLEGGSIKTITLNSSEADIGFYGHGFLFTPSKNGKTAKLEGFWQDNTPFEIKIKTGKEFTGNIQDSIEFIQNPEPATLAYLLFSSIVLLRKKRALLSR